MTPITKIYTKYHHGISECPELGWIFINGQAHDAATLSPIRGKQLKSISTQNTCSDTDPKYGHIQLNKTLYPSTNAYTNSSYAYSQMHQGLEKTGGVFDIDGMDTYVYTNAGTTPIVYEPDSWSQVLAQTIGTVTSGQGLGVCKNATPLWLNGGDIFRTACYAANSAASSLMKNNTTVATTFFGAVGKLYENSSEVYAVILTPNNNAGWGSGGQGGLVYKYVKSTGVATSIATYNLTAAANTSTILGLSRPVTYNNTVNMFVCGQYTNGIQYISLNTDTFAATYNNCTFDWTANGGSSAFVSLGTTTNLINWHMKPFIINGGTHLAVVVGRSFSDVTTNQNDPAQQIYVYEIQSGNPANALKYVTKTPLTTDGQCYGALDMTVDNTGTKLAVMFPSKVSVYQFNATSKAYDLVTSYPVAATSIGVDHLGRLWMKNAANDVYLVAAGRTTQIVLSLDSSAYTYTGSAVSGTLTVYALDDAGAKVAKNILLSVEDGPCQFTANGTKYLSTATLAGANLTVPITITGSGQFNITASESV